MALKIEGPLCKNVQKMCPWNLLWYGMHAIHSSHTLIGNVQNNQRILKPPTDSNFEHLIHLQNTKEKKNKVFHTFEIFSLILTHILTIVHYMQSRPLIYAAAAAAMQCICLDQNEHMPYDLGDWVSENEGGKIEMFGSSVTEVHLPAL